MSMNVQPIAEIQGIKFFNNRNTCLSHFGKMHWIRKGMSYVQSWGTFFNYTLSKISLVWRRVDSQMNPFINPSSLSKKRLVVCVHGLNNNPTQFKQIVNEMQKRDLSDTDIFIPRVLERGNAKLDDMVRPIFNEIVKWAQTSEEKELVLVGISNGGRISRALDAELAKSEIYGNIKKLRFISIVGACQGSSLANLANKIGLWWVMSKHISREMPTNSLRNQRLQKEWIESLALPGIQREYTFIASPHDWQVTNYDSSLMDASAQPARYAIVLGHGHNSIVNAVAKTVAEIILS